MSTQKLVLVRVLQRKEPIRYTVICIRDLLQEVAHAVTEAEKSLDMPSASWRTRKTDDEIQSETEGLRIRTNCVSPCWSQKA